MIHIFYLAAGRSRRFGSNKLLYPFEGKALFSHGLDTLAKVVKTRKDCTLTVVSRYPEILSAGQVMGIQCIRSPKSELGLSYTIRAAIDSVFPLTKEDFLLFVVADQPRLTAQTIGRFLDAARPGLWAATAAFGTRVGNPTLFSARLAPELLSLRADEGGRTLLRRHPERCLPIQAEQEAELLDIDRLEDLPTL